MTNALLASLGMLIAGVPGAVVGAFAPNVVRALSSRRVEKPPVTVVLLLLLVSLRSGLSVLASLSEVATALPGYKQLQRVSRMARLSGLTAALAYADDDLRPVIAQLSRAQRSGGSLTGTVRRQLDSRLAEERTSRIASARSLPVKLMVPVTLLMLPGLILMLYAPSLLSMFDELTGVLG